MKTSKNRDLQFRLFWDGEIEQKTTELLDEYAALVADPELPRETVNLCLARIDGVCDLAESLGFRCEYDPNTNTWKVVEK